MLYMRSDIKGLGQICVLCCCCCLLVVAAAQGDEEAIETAFEQLKSGNVAGEKAFIEEHLLPFGQSAIDAMLEKLKSPRLSETNGLTVENADLVVAIPVLQAFGDAAFSNLLDCASDSNDYLRANAIDALTRWEKEECFHVLSNALNDTDVGCPGDSRVPPSRICDDAYGILWKKSKALGFQPPFDSGRFYSLSAGDLDQKITELKAWWSTNGTDVIEAFNSQ